MREEGSQDAKTEDELAKLFPSAPQKSAKVYSVVGDSKLPAELDRRSDLGACNVHLDNLEGCLRPGCRFDHNGDDIGSRASAAICQDWVAGHCALMGDCSKRHPTRSEMRRAEKKQERRHEKQRGKKHDKFKAKLKQKTKVLAATKKRVEELEVLLAAKGERRKARAAKKLLTSLSSLQATPTATATPSKATTKTASKMPSPQGTKISGFLNPTKKLEKTATTTSDAKSLSATRKLSPVEKQPLLDSASSNSVQGKEIKLLS